MGVSMANEREEKKLSNCCVCLILSSCVLCYIALFSVGMFYALTAVDPNIPTFLVESTEVKAYNLTSANNLNTIINLGVRAENRNSNDTDNNYRLKGIYATVSKGKHHVLAEDTLPGNLMLSVESEAILHIEAVGTRVLESGIAEEVRADAAAGVGRVNLRMYSSVGTVGSSGPSGDGIMCVTCKDVVLDFSRSTVRVQKVACKSRWCL